MNKKQAIAYAQVTLDYMQSTKYNGKITPAEFGIEMNQCFKLYSHDIIIHIADSQMSARKKLQDAKNGCDVIG